MNALHAALQWICRTLLDGVYIAGVMVMGAGCGNAIEVGRWSVDAWRCLIGGFSLAAIAMIATGSILPVFYNRPNYSEGIA